MTTAHERQQKILDSLSENEACTIHGLAELLSVSAMTIHRDLDKLEKEGVVVKVHGGAILRPDTEKNAESASSCPMCKQSIRSQLAFVLQLENGEQKQACCPHCGLMMSKMQNPALMLATDFLRGNKVNALQATYLIKPDLKTCCSPAVIAFASSEDAQRFQQGFGGEIMVFSEAKSFLSSTHAPPENM
ncbi:MAG: DeoR family transcriptional regulator [Chloroflexi bacterium]|nr:DeoR family transcriptional regulator [Chloroflexota bacterium]